MHPFAETLRKNRESRERIIKMRITVISVGKIKEKYLVSGIAEYAKRMSRYCQLELLEVPDEKCPETLSSNDKEIIKNKEGEKILAKIKDKAYVLTLEIDGRMLSSELLASEIEKITTGGNSHIYFIIGGSLGLSDDIKKRSNYSLSFSKMTFPHQIMKLILLEQIYRSFRIIKNEPYHK
jgi:23S rRNA (pseudouridine1915-N3)-methyltransferase